MPSIKLQQKLYSYLNKTNKSIQVFLAPQNELEIGDDFFQLSSDLSDAYIIRCTGGHVDKITHVMDIEPEECMVFYGDTPLTSCTTLHQCVWKETTSWHYETWATLPAQDRTYFKIIKH
jgi:hypothetical protein